MPHEQPKPPETASEPRTGPSQPPAPAVQLPPGYPSLTRGAAQWLEENLVVAATICRVLDDPDMVEERSEVVSAFYGGGYRVVVDHRTWWVLGVYPLQRFGRASRGPRAQGKKHDPRVKLPTDPAAFITLLRRRGFTVTTGRTHHKLTHPARPGVVVPMPCSPSDHRWAQNQAAELRRVFGVDLRRRKG